MTPSRRAEVGFWTVARIARPNRVNPSSANRSPSSPSESAKANTRTCEKWYPPTTQELFAYDGLIERYVVEKATLRIPSIPSAIAQVTSSESSSRSSLRSGRMKTSCRPTPSRNVSGVRTRIETNGSICSRTKSS